MERVTALVIHLSHLKAIEPHLHIPGRHKIEQFIRWPVTKCTSMRDKYNISAILPLLKDTVFENAFLLIRK